MKTQLSVGLTPWSLTFAVSLAFVVLTAAEAMCQTPVPLDTRAAQWVDQVQWETRTDGSSSLVVAESPTGSSNNRFGLQRGDRVVSLSGAIPNSVNELRQLADQIDSNDWELTVLRGDRMLELGQAPAIEALQPMESLPTTPRLLAVPLDCLHEGIIVVPEPREPVPPPVARISTWSFGFEVITFRPEFWTGFEAPVISGAMVAKVLDDSVAADAGLSAGAIVVAVDGRRIDSAEELIRHLSAKQVAVPFTLLAYHGRELQRHVIEFAGPNGPTTGRNELPTPEPLPDFEDVLPMPTEDQSILEERSGDGRPSAELPAPLIRPRQLPPVDPPIDPPKGR